MMGQGRSPGEGLGHEEPPSLGHRGFLGAGPVRLEQTGTQWAWKRTLLGPDAGQELGRRVAAGGFGCGREVMGKGKQRVKSCERDCTLGQGCSGGGSGGESPGQRWVSRASAAVGGTQTHLFTERPFNCSNVSVFLSPKARPSRAGPVWPVRKRPVGGH